MAKTGRRGKRKTGSSKRPVQHTRRRDPGDLMTDARRKLATGEPLDFLVYVSTLVAALGPWAENPFERDSRQPAVTLPELIGSFADVELPETTALLAALAVLAPDELGRARARQACKASPHALPDWLARLDQTSVDRAVESTHVLGDGDNVMLNVRLPGHDLTMVVYIDHNLGTVVKDGFPAPADVDGVVSRLREAADDHAAGDAGVRYGDIPLADARARISPAIADGARMFPPLETETWPASRPLAEWLLRLLPEGGTGYTRPEWSKAALCTLTNSFFGSPFGRGLDDEDKQPASPPTCTRPRQEPGTSQPIPASAACIAIFQQTSLTADAAQVTPGAQRVEPGLEQSHGTTRTAGRATAGRGHRDGRLRALVKPHLAPQWGSSADLPRDNAKRPA